MKKFWDQLKPQERRLVIGIGCVVFLVLNYFLVWPKFGEWRKNSARMSTAEQKMAVYRLEIAKQSDYQRQINSFQGDTDVPGEDEMLKFANYYQTRAVENGVQIENEARRAPRTNEFFVEQQATLDVVAGEKNLVGFLYSLGSSSSTMRVKEMNVHAVEPNRYNLHASITIVASYEKKEGGKPGAAPRPAAPRPQPAPLPPPEYKPAVTTSLGGYPSNRNNLPPGSPVSPGGVPLTNRLDYLLGNRRGLSPTNRPGPPGIPAPVKH